MNIDELLAVMDETLEEAVNLPFTGGERMVDLEKVRDIIDDIRLNIAGNCNICTVSRLKPLSRKTVRERFIVYLYEHKKKDSLVVDIMHTQSQLAEYLNVSRPALSKEINKMMKEGLVIMEGKRIEILDKTTLEKYL